MLKKYKEKLLKPYHIFITLGNRGFFNWMKDETHLKIVYRIKMGKKLNLINPQTYNEKLQWLKLYGYSPEYTNYVDKYKVREHIKNTIGDEYLIPLLGVWNNYDEIDFDSLLNSFVLKCTHDSGSVIICKDKQKFDISSARKILNKSLKRNYYWGTREKPYQNIKPRIIAEKFMVDESRTELKDYKFFCFDGEAKALFVATNRNVDTRINFLDKDFNELPISQYYKKSNKKIEKPIGFNKMVKLAERLSKNIPHVRVDFYNVNEKYISVS